ncbi:MAG: hypothetical protein ACYC7L_16700 [Nitrospirota bacterium]
MSRRSKHKIILVAWLIAFFLIGSGVWGFQAGQLMIIGFFMASLVFYILAALLMRCPKCRMPVLLRPRKFLGMELYTWSILTPDRCRHCGETLN